MATKTWDAASERFTETDAGRIDRLRRLRRIHGVARMMDTAIGIPGTRFRFGADSIMGLVPLVGDAGGALIGLYIVNEARRMGVPNDKLAKMIGNLAVDSVVGSVPLAGCVVYEPVSGYYPGGRTSAAPGTRRWAGRSAAHRDARCASSARSLPTTSRGLRGS